MGRHAFEQDELLSQMMARRSVINFLQLSFLLTFSDLFAAAASDFQIGDGID
jgi:hypothetical protein